VNRSLEAANAISAGNRMSLIASVSILFSGGGEAPSACADQYPDTLYLS
jgi:hypothetical protein